MTDDGRLRVEDPLFDEPPVDMPLDTILGKAPRMTRDVTRLPHAGDDFDGRGIDLREAAQRLLRLPAIADKTFLVTIGDRTVGGMISRDQMVGPWQVPVSRRRRDRRRLFLDARRSDGDGRAHAARAARSGRVRPHGDRARP